MADPSDATMVLLERWYDGDDQALASLLDRNLDWMRRRVRAQLSPPLRQRFDSMDVVQDGVVRLLRYGPRFVPKNEAQFRALVARILVTSLRDRIDKHRAAGRDMAREQALPDEGISRLDVAGSGATPPDEVFEKREIQHWIQVAMELLEPMDRDLIRMRQFEQLSFPEIAEALDLGSASAVRMRYNRALPRLAKRIGELRGAFD